MVIYIDVLIFTNVIIDYIMLYLTALITKKTYNTFRIVLASIFGGISSLMIFFETELFIVNLLVKVIISVLIICITFGIRNIRLCITECFVFLLVSFCFCGLIFFMQSMSNDIFISKNLISYFNISPVTLVALTAIFYLIIRLILKFIVRKASVNTAELIIELFDTKLSVVSLVDSGHTLTDPLTDSQIIILDANLYSKIIGTGYDLSNRKRMIPVKTISNSSLLEGIRCDLVTIKTKDFNIVHKKPIVLKTNQKFDGDFKAIISKSAITNSYDYN